MIQKRRQDVYKDFLQQEKNVSGSQHLSLNPPPDSPTTPPVLKRGRGKAWAQENKGACYAISHAFPQRTTSVYFLTKVLQLNPPAGCLGATCLCNDAANAFGIPRMFCHDRRITLSERTIQQELLTVYPYFILPSFFCVIFDQFIKCKDLNKLRVFTPFIFLFLLVFFCNFFLYLLISRFLFGIFM